MSYLDRGWLPKVFVYIVGQAEEAGPHKIGVCNRPFGTEDSRKLPDIQYGNPREVFWRHHVGFATERLAADVEQRFKQEMAAYRIRGEWFAVDLATATRVLNEIALRVA